MPQLVAGPAAAEEANGRLASGVARERLPGPHRLRRGLLFRCFRQHLHAFSPSHHDNLLAVWVADAQFPLDPAAAHAHGLGFHICLALGTGDGELQAGIAAAIACVETSRDEAAAADRPIERVAREVGDYAAELIGALNE